MRNALIVMSRSKYSIEKLTTRLSSNYGFQRSDTTKDEPKKDLEKVLEKRKLKIHVLTDKRLLLASQAVEKHRDKQYIQVGQYLRLLDENVAKDFANLVIADPVTGPSYVAEVNPSLGLLTTALLEAGVPTIHLFENMGYFKPDLDAIVTKYPGRVYLKNKSLDHVWDLSYVDLKEQTNYALEFLEIDGQKSWEEAKVFHIIGAMTDMTLLSKIIYSRVHGSAMTKSKRIVLHLAIPPALWHKLSSNNKNYHLYSWRTIMFQTMFRYEHIGNLPRAYFYPKCRRRSKKNYVFKHLQGDNGQSMYVVRIETSDDMYKDKLRQADMVPYYYFLRHHYKRRRSRIIPALEKWIPGCGRNLIVKGFNLASEFGQLRPPEIIELYLLFKSWPGYKKSSFISMMDTFPLRMDEHVASNMTAEKIEAMFGTSKALINAQAEPAASQDSKKTVSAPKPNVYVSPKEIT